ncbi:MAG: cytochrome c, partial [Candidatus Eremiobacteraeota bacterium]|nr:cytochrome c [Candidatus Eremiobacteraeota bacterium]
MKALLAMLIVAAVTATAKPVSITLPAPNTTLKDGPNVALARASCLACHSADYIYMQPPLRAKQWT